MRRDGKPRNVQIVHREVFRSDERAQKGSELATIKKPKAEIEPKREQLLEMMVD